MDPPKPPHTPTRIFTLNSVSFPCSYAFFNAPHCRNVSMLRLTNVLLHEILDQDKKKFVKDFLRCFPQVEDYICLGTNDEQFFKSLNCPLGPGETSGLVMPKLRHITWTGGSIATIKKVLQHRASKTSKLQSLIIYNAQCSDPAQVSALDEYTEHIVYSCATFKKKMEPVQKDMTLI